MGGIVSPGRNNNDLVDKLKGAQYIQSHNVEKVFRLVDRGNYLTNKDDDLAYRDNAWRSANLHLSAPCIYAQVMEGLQIGPGMSFLNIGSGTGYLSTMAGLLIGPSGVNHGIEVHAEVVEYAKDKLQAFINTSDAFIMSSFCEPRFSQGNALCLREESQQYDRVYCGASCPSSHQDFIKSFMKVNGILVMPLNDKLLKITRVSTNKWISESVLPVSFSTLKMPDQSLPFQYTQFPPIEISPLQELTREVILSIFRNRVEADEEMKMALINPVDNPSYNPAPEYEFDDPNHDPLTDCISQSSSSDSIESEEASTGESRVFSTRRLHANQLSAFLELARSVALNNRALEDFRDRSQRRGENESGNEEEMFGDDEDNNDDEDLFDMIERVAPDESEQDFDEENETPEVKASSSAVDQEDEETKAESTTILVTNEEGVENKINLNSPQRLSPEEEVTQSSVSAFNENTSPVDNTEDEDMVEVGSEQGPSTVTFEPKKREKFDSGIVDDLDPNMSIENSSSCSSLSQSNTSDSDSDSDHEVKCRLSAEEKELLQNPTECCKPPGRCKRHGKNAHKYTHPYYREPRIKPRKLKKQKMEAIRKYRTLMKDDILQLPLPLPLKVYLNFNRPL